MRTSTLLCLPILLAGLAISPARATNFWLTTSADLLQPTAPPATFGAMPAINRGPGSAGTLYLWAKPAATKTLAVWSLRLVTSQPGILSFVDSTVYNPLLGTTGGMNPQNIVRWEFINEPVGQRNPPQGTPVTNSLQDLQGFSLFGDDAVGSGIGPAGEVSTPSYYNSASGAWLLAAVDYTVSSTTGTAQVYLQLGDIGVNYFGEPSSQTSVVLGALSDPALNGDTQRRQNSATADAVIAVSAGVQGDFDVDGDVDGADFLRWQRGQSPAPNSSGDLTLWRNNFGPHVLPANDPAATSVPEPGAALLIAIAIAGFMNLCHPEVLRGVRPRSRRPLLTAAFLAALSPSLTQAADVISTWDAGVTGNWTDAVNWNTANFPNNGGGLTYDAVIGSGTVTLDQNIIIQALTLSGGNITGPSNLTLNALSNWFGGTMAGTGTTTVASGGSLSFSGGIIQLHRNLVNNGTTNLTSGPLRLAGGKTFANNGSFTAQTNGGLIVDSLGGTNDFNNTGTFTKTGLGFVLYDQFNRFNNSGIVRVEQGDLYLTGGGSGSGQFIVSPGATLDLIGGGFNYTGGFSLAGGTLQLTNYTLEAGTVQGSGTIQATSFTNSSEVAPGDSAGDQTGAIVVSGAYQQTTIGNLTLDIEGTSAGQFDTLAITNQANLGGTLTVDLSDGSIGAGEEFEVITADSLAIGSKFDRVRTVGGGDIRLKPVYDESDPNQVSVVLQSFTFSSGDMNGDGGVGEDDAQAIALALRNPATFAVQNPLGMNALEAGNADGDQDFDFDDVLIIFEVHFSTAMSLREFTQMIRNADAVPEPASAALALLGFVVLRLLHVRNPERLKAPGSAGGLPHGATS